MTEPAETQNALTACCFTEAANKVYSELSGRDKKRIVTLVLLLALFGVEANSWVSLPIHESASALYIEFVTSSSKTVITLIEPVIFCG